MEILVFAVGFLAFAVSTLGTVAGLLVERRARMLEPAVARVIPVPVARREPGSLRVVRDSGVAS